MENLKNKYEKQYQMEKIIEVRKIIIENFIAIEQMKKLNVEWWEFGEKNIVIKYKNVFVPPLFLNLENFNNWKDIKKEIKLHWNLFNLEA